MIARRRTLKRSLALLATLTLSARSRRPRGSSRGITTGPIDEFAEATIRLQVLLLSCLLSADHRLAAQTEFGVDPCEYDYSLMRQRAAMPGLSDADLTFCRDSATTLDSVLASVYRRALTSFTDPTKHRALEQSQDAFERYVSAQQRLLAAVGGDTLHVRRTMVRYRVFFLQKMLGEWTEIDEDATRASMKQDLRNLITAEEKFFAESVKYTSTLSALDLRPSPLNRILSFRLTHDGWAATVGNAKTRTVCAVFIGSTPVPPAVREGEPMCR